MADDVFHNSMVKYEGWMVCIVDDEAMRVMSSVMGMYDLMEQRVTLVESLNKKRAPFHDMGAIYVCAPTADNITKIMNDFMPTEGKKAPLYGKSVFLYFLSKVPNAELMRIKTCKPLLKRLKALSELNVDFLAKQKRAFHFDMGRALPELYRRAGVFTLTHNTIVEKLVSLCATLNEYPHVRFPASCPLSQNLAETFQSKMNEYVALSPNWWYYGMSGHMERDRSTLLLLDRSVDPLTPLMHEFTYQAMVNDLLRIDDDKISYQAENVVSKGEGHNAVESVPKDVLLNDNDALWVELRGRHIADVIQTLSGRIREVVDSNTGAKLAQGSGANMSLTQMAQALKALPEYQEVMSKLSQHMHISHQCMSEFNKQQLLDLAELEQTLATGVTDEGRTVRLNEMVDQVEAALLSLMPKLAYRLIAVFMVSQAGNVSDIIRRRLYKAANLSPDQERGLENFEKLGVSMVERPSAGPDRFGSIFGGKRGGAQLVTNDDSEYASSRYAPKAKVLMTAMAENTLDMDEYPSVLPMPVGTTGSAASVRTKTARSKKGGNIAGGGVFSGPRQIVFLAGGLSFSEVRSAEEVMASSEREFIIGSTHFLKPDEYLHGVSQL